MSKSPKIVKLESVSKVGPTRVERIDLRCIVHVEHIGPANSSCRKHARKGWQIPAGGARATEDEQRDDIAELVLDCTGSTLSQPCVDGVVP